MTERAIEAAARAFAKSKATPDDYGSDEEEAEVIDFIWSAYVPEVSAIIRAYLTALAEDDAAVEAVARAMYAARPARLIHPEMRAIEWDEAQTSVPDRIELCWADARAAIRAMGGA